jgi:pyruvate-ferredoxin/flavodoxin oxidoreductase
MAQVPKNCKILSVMDKTNEEGSGGNPLFLDVLSASALYRPEIRVIGGVYGLASKDFNSDSVL